MFGFFVDVLLVAQKLDVGVEKWDWKKIKKFYLLDGVLFAFPRKKIAKKIWNFKAWQKRDVNTALFCVCVREKKSTEYFFYTVFRFFIATGYFLMNEHYVSLHLKVSGTSSEGDSYNKKREGKREEKENFTRVTWKFRKAFFQHFFFIAEKKNTERKRKWRKIFY